MPRRYGTDAEFDALVEMLSKREGVGNPHALANYILRRRQEENPGIEWTPREEEFRTEYGGRRFALRPCDPEGLDGDRSWFAWELCQGNNPAPVLRFILDETSEDAARAVAGGYLAAWALDWSEDLEE